MNYIHHALIGVGTGALGVLAAEALGAAHVPVLSLGLGALAVAAGSVATDLDHPASFISNTIPSRVVRVSLAVLAIPLLAAAGSYLTSRDLPGTLNEFSSLVWGIGFLRWAAAALFAALMLILLSLLIHKRLHHRGALHSLLFTAGLTVAACAALALLGQPWAWGLCFGWGWLWHILADGLTDQGVPFFWPFNDARKHSLPRWGCGIGRMLLTLAAVGGIIALPVTRLQVWFV